MPRPQLLSVKVLGQFRIQQTVVIIGATIKDVNPAQVDIIKYKKIMPQEFHLLHCFIFIHRDNLELLGAYNSAFPLFSNRG